MNTKDFLVHLYDLLGKNTEYQPQEGVEYILENDVEDYALDYDRNEPPTIRFYCKDGGEYHLTLTKVF